MPTQDYVTALKTYQPKTLLIDSDSVLYDFYDMMSVLNVMLLLFLGFFQLGDLYVQFVFCVINQRFKPSEV